MPEEKVALVNGISMGGGASLMVPMTFSVVTEKVVFGNPKTSIGFHTVWSYMLSHLPGHLGEYLALTGDRFNRKELVAVGLETHFVPSEIPPQTWCVAADGATIDKLQGFIDFSCGGKIDCLLIQPGQACYEPNNPRAHASWCLDAYYRTYKTCDTLGTIVYIDPSYGDCLYI
ncbi:3-hydroxyisobutyryl-CoA hydrolase-like protein 5 isoform X2 [Daucus carota subsp. sativus]|uniref:3-hydroxyisobutyryl-CoA hydrolase-like protein 5 isoform X2 n=2 Tax=Daucus carota subsp. sativus TaxID=79200 RepID=UPI0030839A94